MLTGVATVSWFTQGRVAAGLRLKAGGTVDSTPIQVEKAGSRARRSLRKGSRDQIAGCRRATYCQRLPRRPPACSLSRCGPQKKVLGSASAAHCFVGCRTDHSAAKGIYLHKFHFLPTEEWVAIEPRFCALLREKCGSGDPAFAPRRDESKWPGLRGSLSDYRLIT